MKYSELGAHFNRVMVEAMSWGCVPVCTDLGMKNSLLFKPGVNYIEIPHDIDSESYANIIESALSNTKLLKQIQQNNLELMVAFDRDNVASAIVEFALGDSGEVGEPTSKLTKDAARKMEHFEGW